MTRESGFDATVEVPGDKSMSHRAVLLAALAQGESRIRGFLRAEDTLRTVALVRALGVEVREEGPTTLRIRGKGLRGLREPGDVIDAGNSGTTMRIGAGVLAAQPFLSVLTGDPYLRQRPMGRIVEPLRAMGAHILGRAGDTRPPLCVRGGSLRGIRHESTVASAQVKSAILLAGLCADGPVVVVEPARSRDHTERMLVAMGAAVTVDGHEVRVQPAERLEPLEFRVPGDISSAAFFLVLAACRPGARIRVSNVGVNPLRTGILAVLGRMGAKVQVEGMREEAGEPVADILVEGGVLVATDVPPHEIPLLIDEIPAVCVAAVLAAGRTEVRGAGELRVKESDRIATMVAALRALDVPCGELPDGLWIEGPAAHLTPGTCDTRGDHRIAMALAVLSAATGVGVGLSDTACVDTSFPGFFERLAALEAHPRA